MLGLKDFLEFCVYVFVFGGVSIGLSVGALGVEKRASDTLGTSFK